MEIEKDKISEIMKEATFPLIKKYLDGFIVDLVEAMEKEMGCYFICHDEPTLNVSDSGGTVDMLYEEHSPDYPEIIDFTLTSYLVKQFGKAE